MSWLLVNVEGQTEESFVNQILAPHLYTVGYTRISARLLGNSRQRGHGGGIRGWGKIRREITRRLTRDEDVLVTTMVDYYGLPCTWPGRSDAPSRAFPERASTVERKLLDDVCAKMGGSFDSRRFVPYVVMHEFEGLLFSDPVAFGRGIGRGDLSPELRAIRDAFDTPEEINDSPYTAPSKRIESLLRPYKKPLHGVLAAQEIGLDIIRRECPQFSDWVDRLEQRVS